MPRALKSDKFFLHAVQKRGPFKGHRLLGVNHTYRDGKNITLQHLLDFLKEKGIETSQVPVLDSYMVYIKA